MSRPLVGVTADIEDSEKGPAFRRHELRHAYAQAVYAAGGLPLILPALGPEAAREFVDELDGLVLTGGAFDVPPALYGERPAPGLGPLKPDRTAFEQAALERAAARGIPVLGLCGGMQLMAVVRGGALYQHLPTELSGALSHEQPNDRRRPSHTVRLSPGSLLARATGATELRVNSSHHQGVRSLGRGLVASGTSPDGLVEALEDPSVPFFLGVQWHPELLDDGAQRGIFERLVEACRQ